MSLAQFILAVVQGELKLEDQKQQLAMFKLFEPYTAYKRIDQTRLGGVKRADLNEFLRDHSADVPEDALEYLFQYFDIDGDGIISYDEFKKSVLSKTNQQLRDEVNNRDSYDIDIGMLLPEEVETGLAKFMLQVLENYIEISQNRLDDINLDEVELYDGDGRISLQSLAQYLTNENVDLDEDSLIPFIQLIDYDGDGRGTKQALQNLIFQFQPQQEEPQEQRQEEQQDYDYEQEQEQEYGQQQEQQEEPNYQDESQEQSQQQQQPEQVNKEVKFNSKQSFSGQQGEPQKQDEQQNENEQQQSDPQVTVQSYLAPQQPLSQSRTPLLDYYDREIQKEKEKLRQLEGQLFDIAPSRITQSSINSSSSKSILKDYYEEQIYLERLRANWMEDQIRRNQPITMSRYQQYLNTRPLDLYYSDELRYIRETSKLRALINLENDRINRMIANNRELSYSQYRSQLDTSILNRVYPKHKIPYSQSRISNQQYISPMKRDDNGKMQHSEITPDKVTEQQKQKDRKTASFGPINYQDGMQESFKINK